MGAVDAGRWAASTPSGMPTRQARTMAARPSSTTVEADTGEFRISLVISGEIEEKEGGARVTYRTTFFSDGRAELDET